MSPIEKKAYRKVDRPMTSSKSTSDEEKANIHRSRETNSFVNLVDFEFLGNMDRSMTNFDSDTEVTKNLDYPLTMKQKPCFLQENIKIENKDF